MKAFTPSQLREWHNGLPGKRCASVMVCVGENAKILAVKNTYRDHWMLPGGVTEKHESPLQSAVRELREETGVSLKEKDVEFAGLTYYPSANGMLDSVCFLFKSKLKESTKITPDGDEVEEIAWLTPSEFRKRFPKYYAHLSLAADIAEGKAKQVYTEGK